MMMMFEASSLSVLLVASLWLVRANLQQTGNDNDHVRVREFPKPINEYDLNLIGNDSVRNIVLESEILNVFINDHHHHQLNLTLRQPAASRISRQGSALQCGESNPNGQHRKQLPTTVNNRIIGGQKVEPGQLPFQVRLNIRSRRHVNAPSICGGVVLDERHILTAAHCVSACLESGNRLATVSIESSSVVATIGDHSISRTGDGEQELGVRRITRHEHYDACNFHVSQHDIALLELSQQIQYKFTSDGYGSINRPCLPHAKDLVYPEQQPVVVSGWGVVSENSGHLSNILRQVQLPLVSIQRCREVYGTRVSSSHHVCAGHQHGGKDSCQGDSGGPLLRVTGGNRYELVGIVSFGYGCGKAETPGVYTRVASYLDWIKANL